MSVRIYLFIILISVSPFSSASQIACVLEHCGVALAKCEADTICRTWSNCNRACSSIKDPVKATACQIRCGDLYKPTNSSGAKIDEFSECVISEHHCVKQTKTNCPKPAMSVLDSKFNLKTDLTGVWYITRGLNSLFDCFDCQVHNFSYNPEVEPYTKPLHGDLKYNVKVNLNCTGDDCKYLPREVFQSFSQDTQNPGHLMNYNNTLAEMHYSDDWYVLYASENNVLIYYCGCNDAMCGYGGSVLYSRTPKLQMKEVPLIRKAIEDAKIQGFMFDELCIPQNTFC